MSLYVQPAANWQTNDTNLDLPALARILSAIADSGTVRAAADALGLSYRTVWGRLENAADTLGQPLIVKNRGRGSQLTPAGRELLELTQEFEERLRQAVQSEVPLFQQRFSRLFEARTPALNLAYNYDPVLEACQHQGQLEGWQATCMGARKAVEALLDGRADVVGLHCPEGLSWPSQWQVLKNQDDYLLIPILVREVGLIVAKGNPLGIHAITDLARAPIRFINRQRKAGMRRWFDALLEQANVLPEQVTGYNREEFTQTAVATAVAAGSADTCFTPRAAASGLNVDFVPVGLDYYFLAARTDLKEHPRLGDLQRLLASEADNHAGYRPAASGALTAADGRAD